jgi:predicted O-linked N-acetylglucosamine transferase (SPINDLY family)
VAQLFEDHDRSQFEVLAFSYGDDDGTPMRRRLEKSFDRFFDVRQDSDEEIARLIRQQEIDIMVDLTGHTAGSRLEILASRPAPVQLPLGYPGTLVLISLDYPHRRSLRSGRRVRRGWTAPRPPCRRMRSSSAASTRPTRSVGCLRRLDALRGRARQAVAVGRQLVVEDSLRREAAARSVAPDRLVFAPRQPVPDHLASQGGGPVPRHISLQCHTTASDAVDGTAVLTCGRSFASCVAASLLHAGAAGLITRDLAE